MRAARGNGERPAFQYRGVELLGVELSYLRGKEGNYPLARGMNFLAYSTWPKRCLNNRVFLGSWEAALGRWRRVRRQNERICGRDSGKASFDFGDCVWPT